MNKTVSHSNRFICTPPFRTVFYSANMALPRHMDRAARQALQAWNSCTGNHDEPETAGGNHVSLNRRFIARVQLLLLLHADLAAVRAFPLPLLVVDVSLELLHGDFALSTVHASSI
jgi:hypothetical protein